MNKYSNILMKVERNKEQVKGTDLVIGLRIANKDLCNEGEAKTNQVLFDQLKTQKFTRISIN